MVNKFIGIGRLTRDPEFKETQGGGLCNFSIAINERWKGKNGEQQERVEFVKLVAFGKLAELCSQYLTKGRQVYVEGKLQTRSWEKDGKTNYSTEIVASTVQFLGSGSEKQEPAHDEPVQTFTEDDIPF